MPTLGELKTRIITETQRDDLQDDLADLLDLYIRRSIDFYATSRFWFNEFTLTTNVVVGQQYTPLPVGLRELDKLWLVVGSVNFDLTRNDAKYIEDLYSVPISGQPTNYTVFGDSVRLWPTPNVSYPLIWLGIKDVAPLVSDSDSNFWTNEGQDLIDARTRYLLYRDEFRDEYGARVAELAMDEAYGRLKGETNRRIGLSRTIASW